MEKLLKDYARGDIPEGPTDNPSGPSDAKLLAGPTGDQPRKTEPTCARPLDVQEDHESPPAYIQRHMPKELKIDDLEEQPAPEPIQEPCDVRLDPEFQQQARNRKARRARQNLVEGPCCLRPNSPNLAPLAEPEVYNDLDQQPALETSTPAAPATWSARFQEFYRQICIFSFQFPFHTLLLTWPLATAVMGVMNLNLCPIDLFLPYVMIVVGILGAATIVFRLYTLYFEKMFTTRNTVNYWIGVRTAEAIIWVFLVAQLIYFFKQPPSFTPGHKHYCKRRYYIINCVLMYLSSLTMLGWLVVHITKLILCIRRRNEPAPT